MYYLVDGYNLCFRLFDASENLEKSRMAILDDLVEKLRLVDLDVTIVFDAAHEPSARVRKHRGSLEIVYTNKGESADDSIIAILEEKKHAEAATVVTSDRGLALRAKRLGAHAMSGDAFVAWLDKRYVNKLRKKTKQEKARPSPRAAAKRTKPETRKTPPKPRPGQSPIECFDYYKYIFERRLKKLEESD